MKMIGFIEGLHGVMKEKPEFTFENVLKKQYKEHELKFIEKGSSVSGRLYDLWSPEKGIINIFEGEDYKDPDGLLPLSQSQMKDFNIWLRPHEFYAEHLHNDKIIIADEITGYEVQQKEVGDCSVLSSLAVAAHYEYKF